MADDNDLPHLNEIIVEGAAEGFLEVFNKYKVDYIFCSPGSEFIPFWEYLAKFKAQNKKPSYINSRHEGLALSMAKGYYLSTRNPQVVLLHVVSGSLHGAMELRSIYLDNIPMIIIVGQTTTHEGEVFGGTPGVHYLAFNEVGGIQRLLQPYVKWCYVPDTNLNTPFILSRSFRIALSEPKGPVLVILSRELMFEKTKNMKIPKKINPSSPIQADPDALKKLSQLLLNSENPILYTRYLGRNPATVGQLVELTELISIPVFETPVYMNYPTDHPLHLGYEVWPYLEDADLILIVDSSGRPPWYPPSKVLRKSNAKVAFIDIDPVQQKYPYWGYPADLMITANSNLALPALTCLLKKNIKDHNLVQKFKDRLEKWSNEHKRLRLKWKNEALDVKENTPIDPRWLCHCINEVIDEKTIVVHETVMTAGVIDKYIERNRVNPDTCFTGAGAVGSELGQGLGVALGVKLANPSKTVLALEGDGSFNYNPVLACFGLAQEYSLPFLTILFNNQSYAAMKQHGTYYPEGWSKGTNTYYGVFQKPKPDYEKTVQAFNGYTETIMDPSEVKHALYRAFNQVKNGNLTLLDIILGKP
jgi:acetolactate synthase-1/2/3 large subunit